MSNERPAAEVYADIIDLPHYEPRHPRMSMEGRAAQFSSFAALSGHEAAIEDTARAAAAQYDEHDEAVNPDDML